MPWITGAVIGTKMGADFVGGKKSQKTQQQLVDQQAAEVERQRIQAEQKQREANLRLTNTISGLTNTSYNQSSLPDSGAYTDLG